MNIRFALNAMAVFMLACSSSLSAPTLALDAQAVGVQAPALVEPLNKLDHQQGFSGASPLQFRVGNHLAGFLPNRVYFAALDHVLSVDFLGTTGAMPQTASPLAATESGRQLTRVSYSSLWPGITVVYDAAEDGGLAKTTYQLAPGADVSRIQLGYNLPVELQADGSLRFVVASGRGELTESPPVAWQEIAGRRLRVDVAFVVSGGTTVGFRAGAYDPRYPLVIDPVYAWHTFYGGTGNDYALTTVIDGSGNLYITGRSEAAWQGDGNANPLHPYSGGGDIVIVKMNRAGAYQWHTFYGGPSFDSCDALAVDGSGNVYVAGESIGTWQGDGNASPLHPSTGDQDMAILKLSSAGAYQWHTFYGGTNDDYARALALDGSGNVYVAGVSMNTWQGNGNASPLHPHGGYYEIILMKLTGAGGYVWHTFYGQAGADEANAVALTPTGDVYLGGRSNGTWQGDGNASPLHPHNGADEMVIVKLTSAGSYLWHTFFGGPDRNYTYALKLDSGGNVYVAGWSQLPWQGDGNVDPLHPSSGDRDMVIVKLSGAGTYQWHTFYGGPGSDYAIDLMIDGFGNLYIAGMSEATWQGDGNINPLHSYSGSGDMVIMTLTSAGGYRWHTFYGGPGYDWAHRLTLDDRMSIYLTGYGDAAWQGDGNANPLHPYSSNNDMVVMKLTQTVLFLPLIAK